MNHQRLQYPSTRLAVGLVLASFLFSGGAGAHVVSSLKEVDNTAAQGSDFHRRLNEGGQALKAGKTDLAEKAFIEANRLEPRAYEPMLGLASVAESRGRGQEARGWVERAVLLSQWQPQVVMAQARLLLGQGDSKAAVESYRKAIAANPGHPALRMDFADICLGPLKMPGEAVVQMRELLARRSDVPGAQLRLGDALLADGQLDAANSAYGELVQRDPANYQALTALGQIHLKQGKAGPALGYFDKALQARADWLPGLIGRGDALVFMKKTEQALDAYRLAAERAPDKALPHIKQAILFEREKRYQEQEEAYRNALRVEPTQALLMNNLAHLLASRKQHLDEALTLAKRASESEPKRAAYFDTLGFVMEMHGDQTGARQAYEKAVAMEPANGAYRSRLAQLASPVVGARVVHVTPSPAAAPVAHAVATVTAPVVPQSKADASDPAQVLGGRLESWRKAWEVKDSAAYLAYYAKDFEPPARHTRASWEEERRSRLSKPGAIAVAITQPIYHGNSNAITVVFEQTYQSAGFSDKVRKQMEWVREGATWKIRREVTR